jgi:hypothetical protein
LEVFHSRRVFERLLIEHQIRENGLEFYVDIANGQKQDISWISRTIAGLYNIS